MMSYVETSSTGWLGRIGGSLKGMLFGLLLLSSAVSLTLIALAWLTFRPLIGIPLLVLAAGCVVAVVVMAAKGRSRTLAAGGGSVS